MRSAVLDLGSNSFHVLVAELSGPRLVPVLREREMLHLGAAVARHGHVPADARARAIETVAHLAELARRSGAVTLHAVATSALRDADNGEEVLADIREAADAPIEVLPGTEEARLAYLGVRGAVALRGEPVLVLDLGGGSLELAIGVDQRLDVAASARLGVSRLSTLVTHDPPHASEIDALIARVDGELDGVVEQVQAHAPAASVAVGGTVRALARVVAAEKGTWLPSTLNMLEVSTSELAAVRDRLINLDLEARSAVPGMKLRRADHLHVAAVVLTRALERLGLTTVTVSDWGLREGLLLERAGTPAPRSPHALRLEEIERLRTTFVPEDPHPVHVAQLAGQLFNGMAALHGLNHEDRELLTHAARLHAVGEAIALRRQHEHGAYLVEHAELHGFAPAEAAQLTTLVRFHRSRGIAEDYPPYAGLDADRRSRTDRLLALLQLADGLDRAHDQAVSTVRCHCDDERVELQIGGGELHLTAAELHRRTELFRRTFGRRVEVTGA